jgi:TRAP transporter TAXI family solute receptor
MLRALIFMAACLLPPLAGAADITLVTGPKTGTYFSFGNDMSAVAQSKKMKLNVKDSEGSVDNIKRINSDKALTLGIVQSDVLGFLSRSQNTATKKIVSHLRILFPFYQEEVHVLARDGITDFKELQGKRVAVGEENSGHMLTAVNLFAIEQIVPSEIKKISPEEGVVEVLQGDIDAVILVGGKPLKIFQNMEDLSKPENQKFALLLHNVHFLPLNNARFYEEYEPTEITPGDYSFVKSIIPTIAVQAVLVSYDPPGKPDKAQKERCETLKRFAGVIRGGLPALQQAGHPKWKEVNLSANSVGWAKDGCVWGDGK